MILYYAKNSDSPKDTRFLPRLLYIGTNEQTDMKDIRGLHSHNNYLEFLFILNGSLPLTINGEYYVAKTGDIVCFNQGNAHHEYFPNDGEFNYFFLAFDNLFIDGLPENHIIPAGIRPVFSTGNRYFLIQEQCKEIFESLSFESGDENSHVPLMASSLIKLISIMASQAPKNGPYKSKAMTTHSNLIMDYLHEHFMEQVTLESIGWAVGLSPFYVSHLFKSVTGQPPLRYVMELRIKKAQGLLMRTNDPITEIAFSVGYQNLSNFNYAFRCISGMSPSNFRKKYSIV